jgi:hypothetical protein
MMTRPASRGWLQFPELAAAALTSLSSQLGLAVAKRSPTLVRFEGRSVFVNFYHGRSSYEVGIEVGRRGHPDEMTRPFDLAEIIAVTDPGAARMYRRPQASDLDSLRHVVQGAADQLMKYGLRALEEDPAFFDRLNQVRVERSKDFGRNLRHATARARANELWQRKDYGGVVAALEPLGDAMTAAEAKKYEYSRKHLSAT